MLSDHAHQPGNSAPEKVLAGAWSSQLEKLRELSRASAADTLRGFPEEIETCYQSERGAFIRLMLRISMAFALLSYPLYLEFDRHSSCEFCFSGTYWIVYGISMPVQAVVFVLMFLPIKGPVFYRNAGLAVLIAHTFALGLATAIGTRFGVVVPFEVLMLQLLYVFFLLGFSFRLALPGGVAMIFIYAIGNVFAGVESHKLIRDSYFLIGQGSMCAVGCALAEVAQRRGWLSAQMLQGFSERDGLTGLYHRGAFETRANMAIRLAHRDHLSVSLAVLDLDHFKLLNDRLGHLEGDRCLRRVANLLATAPPLRRPLDFPARLGGEEFSILWFGAEVAWVEKTLQMFTAGLKAMDLKNPDNPGGVLTVSIGVTHYEGDSDMSVEVLLQQADAALYEAKSLGRNQIRFFNSAAAAAAVASAARKTA